MKAGSIELSTPLPTASGGTGTSTPILPVATNLDKLDLENLAAGQEVVVTNEAGRLEKYIGDRVHGGGYHPDKIKSFETSGAVFNDGGAGHTMAASNWQRVTGAEFEGITGSLHFTTRDVDGYVFIVGDFGAGDFYAIFRATANYKTGEFEGKWVIYENAIVGVGVGVPQFYSNEDATVTSLEDATWVAINDGITPPTFSNVVTAPEVLEENWEIVGANTFELILRKRLFPVFGNSAGTISIAGIDVPVAHEDHSLGWFKAGQHLPVSITGGGGEMKLEFETNSFSGGLQINGDNVDVYDIYAQNYAGFMLPMHSIGLFVTPNTLSEVTPSDFLAISSEGYQGSIWINNPPARGRVLIFCYLVY